MGTSLRPLIAPFLGLSLLANAQASLVQEAPFGAGTPKVTLRERYSRGPEARTLGVARMGGLLDRVFAGKTNEACLRAWLTRLDFEALPAFASETNYCELPVTELPKDALALLEKVAEVNARIARLLGEKPETLFGSDLGITVSAELQPWMTIPGSLFSAANGAGLLMSALPDWTAADFSSKIYAHELIHTLTFNPGPIADALLGLQEHPFLIEALPDLLQADAHDSPKLELGERVLPGCLRVLRDATPIRSFGAPFGDFYPLASSDTTVKCCATLDYDKLEPYAKSLCNQYVWNQATSLASVETFVKENGLTATAYDEAHLQAPFEAADCRVRTRTGLVYLDNCDTHQYGYPLVSFFFRLRALTGKSHVAEFFAKIREGASRSAIYECGYSGPSVTPTFGGAKAYVALRPVLGPFVALRESLDSAGRTAFDQAWKEHQFGKLFDLDRIYRNETLEGAAQIAVKGKNTLYKNLKNCGDVYKLDPVDCRVSCEKKL